MRVGQKVDAIGEQEGAEPALIAVGTNQNGLLEQAGEVVLGQIERGVGIVSLTADQGINGEPVGCA